jgi:hypothetical protein
MIPLTSALIANSHSAHDANTTTVSLNVLASERSLANWYDGNDDPGTPILTEDIDMAFTEEEVRATAIADERLELLARKYAGQTSREIEARLAVLNERLSQLWPPILEPDLELLEDVAGDIERMVRSIDTIQSLLSE